MSILFLIGITICLTYFWYGIYNCENNKNWDFYIDYYYYPRMLYYIVTFLIGILLSLIWPLFIIPLIIFIIKT